jgi:histidinol dehydrogenase
LPDDPTLGEIARRLAAVHQDLKEDLREYGKRLDKKVSLERYQLEQRVKDDAMKVMVERVRGLEEQRAQEVRDREREQRDAVKQRRTDRRLVFTALVAPVLLLLMQAYLSAQGAGG